jgi:hypothetical protein
MHGAFLEQIELYDDNRKMLHLFICILTAKHATSKLEDVL